MKNLLHLLCIRFVNPKYFKVNTDEYLNVINYEVDDNNTFVAKPRTTSTNNALEIWQPWQFVHFLLADETTEPYGKSMLWSMRSAFDQLSTLEALLGISRMSKIQRLVFWVPLPRDTAITDSYGYMNEFRSNYLNSIFTDAPGAKAGRKIPGATSILTLPKAADGTKVDVDVFDCNMDISEILLSSDGLTNMLDISQIEHVLLSDYSVEEKVTKLIDKANNRGGSDNISVAYLIRKEGVTSGE